MAKWLQVCRAKYQFVITRAVTDGTAEKLAEGLFVVRQGAHQARPDRGKVVANELATGAKDRGDDRLHSFIGRALLLPLQGGLASAVTYDHYDTDRERVAEKRSVPLSERSALLLDGPFLFQEDLSAYFDFRIYLVTDFERAIEIELEQVPEKKRRKHEESFVRSRLGAQSLYLRKEAPWKRAHVVIRGVNSERPVIENVADDLFGETERAMSAD